MTLVCSSIGDIQGIESESDVIRRRAHWRVNNSYSSMFISIHQFSLIPIPDSPYCDWRVHHITQSDATGEDEIQALEETSVPWRPRDDGRWRHNCMWQNRMKSMHHVGTMIVQLCTLNRNICCSNSRDVHSSLWDVEPGSAGVSPSMTGPQRGEGEERRC